MNNQETTNNPAESVRQVDAAAQGAAAARLGSAKKNRRRALRTLRMELLLWPITAILIIGIVRLNMWVATGAAVILCIGFIVQEWIKPRRESGRAIGSGGAPRDEGRRRFAADYLSWIRSGKIGESPNPGSMTETQSKSIRSNIDQTE